MSLMVLPWPRQSSGVDDNWDPARGIGDWEARLARLKAEPEGGEDDDDEDEDEDEGAGADVHRGGVSDECEAAAKQALVDADAVCFDVDSTVLTSEGIDELAKFLGCDDTAELTAQAMSGAMPFHEALARRLAKMAQAGLSLTRLEEMLEAQPLQLTPGIKPLVDSLHARGVHVYLVSGGFHRMIEPSAKLLGIPLERVVANRLRFGADGSFLGHDQEAETARSGGKAAVVSRLKAAHGYRMVVMVGDGATDMEARAEGGANAFIGFGGNVKRDQVVQGADWFVTDFCELTALVL
jgi:phosphoserine phosphatase